LGNGPIISIVEDDAAVRAATENLVKSLGFDVYTFASAQEFLQSHHVAETACLISDMQMPNMSGIELQATLVNRGFRIPTIFMTAFPDESVRRRAMDAGAIGFLYKPCDGKALIQFIQDAIRQGGGKLNSSASRSASGFTIESGTMGYPPHGISPKGKSLG
jgi:FixJ family two-component response regulator